MARIVLIVAGVIMTGVGLLYVVHPGAWQPGEGLTLTDPAARIEVRAVYGGIELSIGLFLLFCSRRRADFAIGLLMASLLGWCAGGGRLVGAVFEGGIDAKNVLWATIEIGGATVAWLARRRVT